jgi:hypothetical protein
MNGAFVLRALGPSLPQSGIFRASNLRSVCVGARRIRKAIDETEDEAPALAADAVPTRLKRAQKPQVAAEDEIETHSLAEIEAVTSTSRSRRRKTVDLADATEADGAQKTETKPARRTRKKTVDAEAETSLTAETADGVAGTNVVDSATAVAKPKRASRKKAAAAADGDVGDATAAAEPKPKAKRSSKKSKEPEIAPDVVSTRGRRKVESAEVADDDQHAAAPQAAAAPPPPAPTAAAQAAKRRSGRAVGRRAAAGAAPQTGLAELVIQRNHAG